MSQTYVIKVSASVQEDVSAKDRRSKKLVLTEIVPCDEQKEILREKLAERGWAEQEGSEGNVWTKTEGEVTSTLDLESMTVEASVEKERTLERERTIVVRGDRDFEDQSERKRKEQKRLEESIAITDQERDQVQTTLQRQIAEALDETEQERNQELNEVVRDVYAESLKRKAGRVGNVTEVREGQAGGDYELVIKITQ
jgi:DNA anti-recombination protein RmuC